MQSASQLPVQLIWVLLKHLVFTSQVVVIYSKYFQMSKAEKSKKIVELLDCIEDEVVLNQVMEDVAFYASKKDIVDELNAEQLNELDKAIEEANKNETISWNAFKNEMTEWRSK